MKYKITVRKPTEKDLSRDRPFVPSQEDFEMAFDFLYSNINERLEGAFLANREVNSFTLEIVLNSKDDVRDALELFFIDNFEQIQFQSIDLLGCD